MNEETSNEAANEARRRVVDAIREIKGRLEQLELLVKEMEGPQQGPREILLLGALRYHLPKLRDAAGTIDALYEMADAPPEQEEKADKPGRRVRMDLSDPAREVVACLKHPPEEVRDQAYWENEVAYLTNMWVSKANPEKAWAKGWPCIAEAIADKHYLRIIGIGGNALIPILKRLRHEDPRVPEGYWFCALKVITGITDPSTVSGVYQGNSTRKAWISWLEQHFFEQVYENERGRNDLL